MLRIRDLTRPGIEPFSLDLDGGECVALAGPSGAGKTLLLRAIADLDPNRGTVLLDDSDRDAMAAPEWRRSVAYLAPEAGWWADGVGAHFPDFDAAAALLPALGLGADTLDWPVGRLSTGERQRLALARLLLTEPLVMLLDEPTSGLDSDTTAMVEAVLGHRLRGGAAILLVTHDGGQAERMARRRLIIEAGRVREQG